MRKYAALGMIAAMGLGAQAASAEGFSYNLIEGSYAFLDAEGTDIDGFGVSGAAELTANLHAFGGLSSLEADGGSDLDLLNLGLGVNFPINENLDFVGGASFERIKGFSSESGWGLAAGLRGRVAGSLELTGGLKYSDVGDVGNIVTWSAGGRWYFTPNFAVGADYTSMDFDDAGGKIDGFIVSLRYDFGSRM
jgi:hypothetical protein